MDKFLTLNEANTIIFFFTAIATWILAIVALRGLRTAKGKLSEDDYRWHKNLETQKMIARSKPAAELTALALKIQDAMHDIRSRWFRVPADKANNELYFYEQRYERIAEYNDLFEKLRDIQIQVKTIIGDVEVEQAVENLFSARHRIRVAIESLIMYAKLNDDGEYRVAIKELKEILLEDINETDATSQEINNAIKTIQTRLTPIVQMNE